MSAVSNYIRQYKYDQQSKNTISDYSKILKQIHNSLESDLRKRVLKNEAIRLQGYLQKIKSVIIYFSNASSLKNVKNASEGLVKQQVKEMIEDESINTYLTIVENAMAARRASGSQKTSLNLLLQSHYKNAKKRQVRSHLEGTSTVSEDDLHYIAQGLEQTITNMPSTNIYYTGREQVHILENEDLGKNLVKDINTKVNGGIRGYLEKEAKKYNEKYALTDIAYETSAKVDFSGKNLLEIIAKYEIQDEWLKDFATLMAQATISLKGYVGTYYPEGGEADWKDPGLHLGKSFLLKPVVAVTDKLGWSNVDRNGPRDIFYRGAQTLVKTNRDRPGHPTATSDEIIEHFTHMRYTYELTGYGLYDNYNNNESTYVKYIIYNDPQSERVYVKDTASLLLEFFKNKSSVSDLYSIIKVKASSIQS